MHSVWLSPSLARFSSAFTNAILCKLFLRPFFFFLHFLQFSKNRCIHQEQKFPSVQVIKGGQECRIHCGGGQQIRCQTWEEHFWRGKPLLGFFSQQCEVKRLHVSSFTYAVIVLLLSFSSLSIAWVIIPACHQFHRSENSDMGRPWHKGT